MHVFISSIMAVSLFLLSGCIRSALTMPERDLLIIANEKSSIEVKSSDVETTHRNMGSITVVQKVLAVDEKQCLVYEDISTAPGYRFNYAYKRSIDLIFNAYRVEKIKAYGNITLYRVILRDEDKTSFNLLALTASKKSLRLLYGYDDDAQAKIEEGLEHNATVRYELAHTSERRDHCIKSSWQPKLLVFDNLVGKEGGMKMRGGGL